jgi:hypothetical protein
MMTVDELLRAHGIKFKRKARYYTTCPQCSAGRSTKGHQMAEVLCVTIDGDSAIWGCNHCNWSGRVSKTNGHANGPRSLHPLRLRR